MYEVLAVLYRDSAPCYGGLLAVMLQTRLPYRRFHDSGRQRHAAARARKTPLVAIAPFSGLMPTAVLGWI
jgi:hypothetical protein